VTWKPARCVSYIRLLYLWLIAHCLVYSQLLSELESLLQATPQQETKVWATCFHILLYSVFPWISQKFVSLFVSLLWRCCLQCTPYFTSIVNSMRSCWMIWWLRTKPCVNSCQHCYICLAPWLLR